jgi:hypothetical protein
MKSGWQCLRLAKMFESRRLLNLNLDGDLFRKLPRREQSEVCRLFAERAQNLATKSPPVQQQLLLNIASQWLYLADLINNDND